MAAAEECREHDALRVAGVLVLVEQHHPVAGTQRLADLRAAFGQPRGRRHLRTEVHHPIGVHPGVQGVDERDEGGALGLGAEHVEQFAIGVRTLTGARRQGEHQTFEFVVGVAQLRGVDEVLGELVGQRQHQGRHRGGGVRGGERAGVVGDDVVGELPAFGVGEQPGVGFYRP